MDLSFYFAGGRSLSIGLPVGSSSFPCHGSPSFPRWTYAGAKVSCLRALCHLICGLPSFKASPPPFCREVRGRAPTGDARGDGRNGRQLLQRQCRQRRALRGARRRWRGAPGGHVGLQQTTAVGNGPRWYCLLEMIHVKSRDVHPRNFQIWGPQSLIGLSPESSEPSQNDTLSK